MSATSYDVVVLGLGIMGSAVAFHLARRGCRVLGVDRAGPASDRGSSFGESRMIRRAYPEHSAYAPLVERAYDLWRELESVVGRELLLPTGGLVVGRSGQGAFDSIVANATAHGVRHSVLPNSELVERFPQLRFLAGDEQGYLENDAGLLLAERCVRAHQDAAVRAGAELRFGAEIPLVSLDLGRRSGDPIEIGGGGPVTAELLVVAAGPWAALLSNVGRGPALRIERIVAWWFDPEPHTQAFAPGHFPFTIWDAGADSFCLLPALERGIKAAFRNSSTFVDDPDLLDRAVAPEEQRRVTKRLLEVAPILTGSVRSCHVGMYTNTRDEHFIVDHLGDATVLVSACSGHGFKFAPVVGEAVADLVMEGRSRHSLDLFRLDRFGRGEG